MKRIMNNPFYGLIILVIFISVSYNATAQRNVSTMNTSELLQWADQDPDLNLKSGFCHDITVELDLQFVSVSTTITICCNTEHYICVPVIGKNSKIPKDAKSIKITKSKKADFGNVFVEIINGTYALNDKGEIPTLMFKVTKK